MTTYLSQTTVRAPKDTIRVLENTQAQPFPWEWDEDDEDTTPSDFDRTWSAAVAALILN